MFGETDGLPPALVVTAEFDPLRDGGERYAQKMVENGGKVTRKRYPGMIHLFCAMTDRFDAGHDVYKRTREEVRGRE
jgi:acetyl esterase